MPLSAMQKPLALSIAVCLGLTGCQVFKKSEAWETTQKVRPEATARDPDPSRAYASKLHGVLADRGIEHKVVVYQYRYTTRLREEAVGTRTAVIYRDETNPGHPWWLKDDRLNSAVWLPNGNLDEQVTFYLRRKAEVIEEKQFSGERCSGKTSVAFAKPTSKLRPDAERKEMTVAKVAPVKVAPVKKAPAPEPIVVRKPVLASVIVKPKPAAKPIEKSAPMRVVAAQPEAPKLVVKSVAKPAPVPARIVVKPAPARVIRKPIAVRTVSKPASEKVAKASAAEKPVEKKIAAQPAPVQKAELQPVAKSAPLFFSAPPEAPEKPAAIASRSSTPWTAPSVLDPEQQPAMTAPRDRQMEKIFRQKHGSDYNPFSPADRRKMVQLQKGIAQSRE